MQKLVIAFADGSNGEVYPQVEHIGPGFDLNAPAVQPGSVLQLDAGTRFTDIVTQALVPGPVLVVSPRLDGLLRPFDLMAHRRVPVEVALSGERRPYTWLQFDARFAPGIDWQRSRFLVRRDGGACEATAFGSEAAAASTARALAATLEGELLASHFAFVEDRAGPDLFVATLGMHDYFVSDSLAKALLEARLSGLRLQPLAS